MKQKYDAWRIRAGQQKLDTPLEYRLMKILVTFGASIDPQGYDDGDYDEAMTALLKLIKE